MTVGAATGEFALHGPELLADPYGSTGRLREEAPVTRGRLWDGSPVWIVTRYDDVGAVLADRRFASNTRSLPGCTVDAQEEFLAGAVGLPRDLVPLLSGNLVHVDPPDHTRLRKLVARAFSASRIARLRPEVEAITAGLLDRLPAAAAPDGTVDLIEHFAYPLPISVICELLGVPEADRADWRTWSADFTSMDAVRLRARLATVAVRVRELADRRRAEPTDDLLTALVQATDGDSGGLTDTELATMVLTLLVAGHETTAHLLGNGLLALLTHPDQLALLRADPGLLPGAVQELLRWCSPVVITHLRYAVEDVTVAGTRVRQGDKVQLVLGSANHDPRRFPDPERLDVTRRPDAHHLAYAPGLHYCLGASLANQEAEVAFGALLARYGDLELAVPAEELAWQPVHGHRALIQLPVRLGAPTGDGRP